MSSYTFNTGIPAANNNPSNDQPQMLQNNVSTNGILGVDHITFNASNGGTHKQMSMAQFSTPVLPSGAEAAVLYPDAGKIDTAHSQLYFKNFDGTYPLSIVKAYGVFTASTTPSFSAQINCASIAYSSGVWTVTFTSNAIYNGAAGVLASASGGGNSFNYTLNTAAGTLAFSTVSGTSPVITFVVLQI